MVTINPKNYVTPVRLVEFSTMAHSYSEIRGLKEPLVKRKRTDVTSELWQTLLP